MRSLTTLTLAGLAAATVSSAALAADLMPPPPPPAYAPVPLDVGSGWYLRGDVGVSNYRNGKFSSPDQPPAQFFGADFGAGSLAGVGIGYQFNPFLRGDITGEYRFSNGISGSRSYEYTAGYLNGNELRGRINETTKGNFDAAVVLANAYFDLGTWYGVTPFVGGGVGVAFNHISSTQTTGTVTEPTFVTADPCGCNGYYNKTVGAYYQAKSTNSLAWALHAGLAYDVTPNFKVELAYRYLNLGSAKTGAGYEPCCTQSVGFYKEKSIEAHDVKIGLRYLMGGYAAPLPPLMADYQPAPGPLVRKY